MIVVAQAPQPVPPPPPAEERRAQAPSVPPPPGVPAPSRGDWDFPGGLSVVGGIANPEWAHVGVAYRNGMVGGGLNLGTQALANSLSGVLRLFASDDPDSLFLEAGTAAVRLIDFTPGQTPQDTFYVPYVGLGWQFHLAPAIFNVGAGVMASPPRSAAPPLALVSSSLLPHFLLEAGYAF